MVPLRKSSVVVLLVLALLRSGPQASAMAAGSLDDSFGHVGSVTTSVGTNTIGGDTTVSPDGSIVVAGSAFRHNTTLWDPLVMRYTPEGELDASFSGDGIATIAEKNDQRLTGVAIQADGRIVAGGYTYSDGGQFMLVRYLPNGSLDSSFGGDGIVRTPFAGSASANALALQPDGAIVLVGSMGGNGEEDFAVARYLPDGSLDTSFAGNGKTTFTFVQWDRARAVAIDSQNRIVVAGSAYEDDSSMAFARLLPTGDLDATFGLGGKRRVAQWWAEAANAIVLLPDDSIIAGGVVDGSSYSGVVAHVDADGDQDTAFGGTGMITIFAATGGDGIAAAELVGDHIVLGAFPEIPSGGGFLVKRVAFDGTIDTGFGDGGTGTGSFGGYSELQALDVDADGNIVATGWTWDGIKMVAATARFLGSGTAGTPTTVTIAGPGRVAAGTRAMLTGEVESIDEACLARSYAVSKNGVWDADRVTTVDGEFTFSARVKRKTTFLVAVASTLECDAGLATRLVRIRA